MSVISHPARLIERPAVVAGIALAGLLLALAPWPGLAHAYAVAVCHVANVIAAVSSSKTSLHFDPATREMLGGRTYAEWHAVVTMTSSASGASTRTALNLRAIGYIPTAAFVAMSLAWPSALGPRRWQLRAIGFTLVQGFVLVSAVLPLILVLSSDRVRALDLGPTGQAVLRMVFEGAVVPPGMSYAMPACIWLLVVAASRGVAPVAREP